MKYTDKNSLAISFPIATGKNFPIGAAVALTATGVIDTPPNDQSVIGIVASIDTENRTAVVSTNFRNVVKGRAGSAITAGSFVREVYASTASNGVPTYTPATSGVYAIGIALQSAAANADVEVAIFNSVVRLP